MGKGDIKTRKGKIFAGSFGKTRQKKSAPAVNITKVKAKPIKKTVEKTEVASKKETVAKKAAPKKDTTTTTTAAKKAAPKKETAAKKTAPKKTTTAKKADDK
jgi:ribosomal small subunit protein bTHX